MKKMKYISLFVLLMLNVFCLTSFAQNRAINKVEEIENTIVAEEHDNAGATVDSEDLLIGDFVHFGYYYDEPILWRVISFDQERHPILYSEEILCYKAFDSANSGVYDGEIYNKQSNPTSIEIANALGSSRWRNSTIRAWLNSNQVQVDYLLAPPEAVAMSKDTYAYDTEAGFLSHFSALEYSALFPITHKTLLINNEEVQEDIDGGTLYNNMESIYGTLTYGNYDDIRYENVEDKVFLLSAKEFTNWVVEKGWVTTAKQSKAIEKINPHKKEFALWLRTASGRPDNPLCVYADLNGENYSLYDDYTASEVDFGIRPAICVNDRMINIVKGGGTKETPFEIEITTYAELDNIYEANKYMTKEEFCEHIIGLYERLSFTQAPPIGANPFIDTAHENVIQAYQLNLITDENDGHFEPLREITQEEFQEVIERLLKTVYKEKTISYEYAGFSDSSHFILREDAELLLKNIYESIKSQIGGNFVINVYGVNSDLEENIIIIDDLVYLPAEKAIEKIGGKTNGIQSDTNGEMCFIMDIADNEDRVSVYTAPEWNQLIVNRNGKELPWMTLERSPVLMDGLYMIPVEVFEKGFNLDIEIDMETRVINVSHIQ